MILGIGVILFILLVFCFLKINSYLNTPVDRSLLANGFGNAFTVYDRHGMHIKTFLPSEGGVHIPVPYEGLSPHLINAVVAVEDKRFFSHHGVDIISLFRAATQNIIGRRVVSGGSTITQQLVRRVHRVPKNLFGKAEEIFLALRYERSFSKKEIFIAYMNGVFFGDNTYGPEAAARRFFGTDARTLTPSEAAFLAGIVKSGMKFDPYRRFSRADERRRYVLVRMRAEKLLSERDHRMAIAEGIAVKERSTAFPAPHFALYIRDSMRTRFPDALSATSTLDLSVQGNMETVLRNGLKRVASRNAANAALIVLDAKTAQVRAMVGSLDYLDEENAGMINGARSLRQPGSALKPFLYAYVLDKGNSPADIIADVPTSIPVAGGQYSPENFDRKFHGPVSIRDSLASSLNVPAVKWLARYSVEEYRQLLIRAGLTTIRRDGSYYGVSLALGTAEVRLADLAGAYTVFANEGYYIPPSYVSAVRSGGGTVHSVPAGNKRRVVSPEAAYMIVNILTDRNARLRAFPDPRGIIFPFDIAVKTGTSKNFRDAWAVGLTPDHIVAVWIGDFHGSAMEHVSGGGGALPILYDAFLSLNEKAVPSVFPMPESVERCSVCTMSGQTPTAACPQTREELILRGTERAPCRFHFPGSVLALPKEYDHWRAHVRSDAAASDPGE
ncbi:MAG: penicillin-binding protein 1C [Spirochaetota bacterium]